MSPTESIAALAGPLDAVLFDMDGVVTDTAQAHAAAWKRLFDELLTARASDLGEVFRPFDTGRDYRQFVDGKARDDGVRSFLASRSITLPEGADGDASDAQTVRALGARKNGFFNDWLKHNPVQPYPGTLALIHALREASIKTAVFSASRNAEVVLRSAGVLELFDAKVDGEDAARLGLPGKPDPALMQEAAARLGVVAARCAVVEDALAGVQAGAAGGFGLVVGVDRCSQGEMLRRAGATAVVNDLAELVLLQGHGLGLKTLANLPSVWQHEGELRQRMAGKQPAVFLDYDGTLTPIVEDHSKALITDDMREAVRRLSRICTVAIVSGRDLAMLTSLVKLDSVWYAGSHGFEIAGPQGSTKGMERGVEFLPELARAEQMLRERLAGVAGHSVER
ncbi:MAG: trehalose-phosphatase, partial [Rhizobacter sp.]|nr:trehalose-phosphatase [Rhizobacter sp.]